MKQEIHNYYTIEVFDKDKKLLNKVNTYNTAYPEAYLQCGFIDTITLVGSGLSHLIEPYDENPEDHSTYWYRNELPYLNDTNFISGFRARIDFPAPGSSGQITSIRLSAGVVTISEAELKDIEGQPIFLNYTGEDTITINAFIYFITDMGGKDDENNHFKNYPIKYFQPCNSILCGCCGEDSDLLVATERYRHKKYPEEIPPKIKDGYLPFPRNRYIGFSKSPIPQLSDKDFLLGGINNYVTLLLEDKSDNGNYKNALVSEKSRGLELKGLVRSIVLPAIGLIDLNDTKARFGGPLNEGILKGSKVYGQKTCYVPEEYIASGAPVSPISLTKSPFYYAPKITVIRKKNELISKEIPLNEAFFSDIISLDQRECRCKSFSQHVPLTNYYCGAETVIPCTGGKFINEDAAYYGYDIIYSGETTNKKGETNFSQYIAASYLVVGEYTYEDAYGDRHKTTFPCKLEYSFDGIDFFTVAEANNSTEPYEKITFNTVAAPIWKLTSTAFAPELYAAKNTTHGDKNISEISGTLYTRYDPLFIFVGYDGSGPIPIEGADPDKTQAAINKAAQITGNFSYGDSMACGDFETTVPYLYHPNDCIYFNGSLKWGYD